MKSIPSLSSTRSLRSTCRSSSQSRSNSSSISTSSLSMASPPPTFSSSRTRASRPCSDSCRAPRGVSARSKYAPRACSTAGGSVESTWGINQSTLLERAGRDGRGCMARAGYSRASRVSRKLRWTRSRQVSPSFPAPSPLSPRSSLRSNAANDAAQECATKIAPRPFMTGAEASIQREKVLSLTTGSTSFDAMLGGGIQTQSMTEGIFPCSRCAVLMKEQCTASSVAARRSCATRSASRLSSLLSSEEERERSPISIRRVPSGPIELGPLRRGSRLIQRRRWRILSSCVLPSGRSALTGRRDGLIIRNIVIRSLGCWDRADPTSRDGAHHPTCRQICRRERRFQAPRQSLTVSSTRLTKW